MFTRLKTLFLCAGATTALAASATAQSKNEVVGTWKLVSAQADPAGKNTPVFGPHPSGYLIFTRDLHFAVVVNNPDVAKFAAKDRTEGTAEEKSAAIAGALALYGTYTVDKEGRFFSEHVVGCTFPNWNGLDRDRRQITETVQGDKMIEHLTDPGTPAFEIIWQRVK